MMALIILHANVVVLYGGLDNFAHPKAVWTNKVALCIYYMRVVAFYVPLALLAYDLLGHHNIPFSVYRLVSG
jgi:hypothetical protein